MDIAEEVAIVVTIEDTTSTEDIMVLEAMELEITAIDLIAIMRQITTAIIPAMRDAATAIIVVITLTIVIKGYGRILKQTLMITININTKTQIITGIPIIQMAMATAMEMEMEIAIAMARFGPAWSILGA